VVCQRKFYIHPSNHRLIRCCSSLRLIASPTPLPIAWTLIPGAAYNSGKKAYGQAGQKPSVIDLFETMMLSRSWPRFSWSNGLQNEVRAALALDNEILPTGRITLHSRGLKARGHPVSDSSYRSWSSENGEVMLLYQIENARVGMPQNIGGTIKHLTYFQIIWTTPM
jgi:hypothetical protein